MPTPIPPTLSPFVKPAAPGSLTLITSVLDATSNWLLLRHIYASLRPERQDVRQTKPTRVATDPEAETANDKNEDLNIILISFLRPFELWKEMGKKIGLDLPTLFSSSKGTERLIYIDAFTHLSFPSHTPTPPLPQRPHPKIHILPPFTSLAALENQILSLLPTSTTTGNQQRGSNSGSNILILDQPDLLLSSKSSTSESISPAGLSSLILTLRSRASIHSTIITLSADAPLLHPATDAEATPLETSSREFLSLMAHQADRVLQLRGLETGKARDVGGVFRVSKAGEAGGEEDGGEFLYEVKADGGVRVWRRGE